MKVHDTSSESQSTIAVNLPSDVSIAQLVGEIYENAAITERKKILACLLRPLGVLAVFGVANGVFARILFRNGQHDGADRLADIGEICAGDVTALVDYVQQLGSDSLDGLSQLLSISPVMACSGAAALLVAALLQSARSRNADLGYTAVSSLALRRDEHVAQHLTDTAQSLTTHSIP